MTRPSLSVRLAGRPFVCLALLVVCALVIWGWFQGDVSWWLGLTAAGVALRTLKANRQLQRYKTWLTAWNAMAEDNNGPQRPPRASAVKGNPARVVLLVSVSLVVGLPALAPPSMMHSQGVAWIWLAACAIVLWRVLAAVRRHRRKGAKAVQASAAVDSAVAWLLPLPSSSPSWQAARQQVPDYCQYLLNPSAQKSITPEEVQQ